MFVATFCTSFQKYFYMERHETLHRSVSLKTKIHLNNTHNKRRWGIVSWIYGAMHMHICCSSICICKLILGSITARNQTEMRHWYPPSWVVWRLLFWFFCLYEADLILKNHQKLFDIWDLNCFVYLYKMWVSFYTLYLCVRFSWTKRYDTDSFIYVQNGKIQH